MGAEVVSGTPDSPLAAVMVVSSSSQELAITKNSDADEDENDTFSSASTSAQTTECCTSSTATNESDDDMEEDTDDRCAVPKPNKNKRQEHQLSILSRVLEKKSFSYVLIPAALLTACQFLESGSPSTSIDTPLGWLGIPTLRRFLSALASSLSHRYMAALEEHPVLTKALTTGVIQFFGDWAAQRYEQEHEPPNETSVRRRMSSSNPAYDLRRGFSLFADGLLLSGPLLHYCFEWMEAAWPTEGGDDEAAALAKPLATLCHVFVNDYIIDSIYIGLSFVFTGVVEGYSLEQVAGIFRKDYGATVRASWLTSLGLIPIEILCFGYLSLSVRVLAMNFVDLLWGAIVSFYSHRSRRRETPQLPCNNNSSSKEGEGRGIR